MYAIEFVVPDSGDGVLAEVRIAPLKSKEAIKRIYELRNEHGVEPKNVTITRLSDGAVCAPVYCTPRICALEPVF